MRWVQQGDPLGPIIFCLAMQSVLNDLTCPLKIAFMDDITLGGPSSSVVAEAVDMVAELKKQMRSDWFTRCVLSYGVNLTGSL